VALNFDDLTQVRDFFMAHADADVLVNSVGINIPKSILDMTEADYDAVMNANVKIAFFQTQHFVQAKQARSSRAAASVIHISSQMGYVGGPERSVYCASKHALEGMCKAASLELGKWNIRINTICPTFIETELTRSTLEDPAKREHILRSIVLNRLGKLEDLYGAVVYLASDASLLVTGTALKVDGGWTAH
ncbi:MAG: SDR family oxidoreductase, partial [Spirochaetota bacterium]